MDGPMTRLALVHTVAGNVPVFERLVAELLPGVETTSIVDESLLNDAITVGGLTDDIRARLDRRVREAVADGADAILVTCSSVGSAVEDAARGRRIPVVRVDQPMAEEAVRAGSRIGVLATLRTTLEPTADLVRRVADRDGRSVEVIARVAGGAFEALQAGDVERHDALVTEAFAGLRDEVDVVLLAQASMARILDALPEPDRRVPVLASPRLGVERMAELLSVAR
jgi:Asp/Glu/hydantoin racemase